MVSMRSVVTLSLSVWRPSLAFVQARRQAGNWSEDIEVHIGMAKCSLTQALPCSRSRAICRCR